MGQGRIEPFSESKTYAVVRTLYGWTASSRVLSLLDDERVLFGCLAGFVLASVVAVFRSNLGAGVKFLSFALLFVALAVPIHRLVDPPTE